MMEALQRQKAVKVAYQPKAADPRPSLLRCSPDAKPEARSQRQTLCQRPRCDDLQPASLTRESQGRRPRLQNAKGVVLDGRAAQSRVQARARFEATTERDVAADRS